MKKPSEKNKEEDQPYEQFDTDDKDKKKKEPSFFTGKKVLIGLMIIAIAIILGFVLNKKFPFLPGASKKESLLH